MMFIYIDASLYIIDMIRIITLALIAITVGVGTLATAGFTAFTSALAQTTMDITTTAIGGNMTGDNMTDASGSISGRGKS